MNSATTALGILAGRTAARWGEPPQQSRSKPLVRVALCMVPVVAVGQYATTGLSQSAPIVTAKHAIWACQGAMRKIGHPLARGKMNLRKQSSRCYDSKSRAVCWSQPAEEEGCLAVL